MFIHPFLPALPVSACDCTAPTGAALTFILDIIASPQIECAPLEVTA